MKNILKAIILFLIVTKSNSVYSQLSPMSFGTIKPEDSIVIYYDVTINTGAGSQVSNQGSISGSNFTSLVTNDPMTGTADDPTISFLNMFPLPVNFIEVKAKQRNSTVDLSWKVSNEDRMIRYDVERSINGRTFTKIGEVAPKNNAAAHTYLYIDQNPGSGINYYRLRIIDQISTHKFSNIVSVDMTSSSSGIQLSPNPTQNHINLQLSNMQRGHYELLLYANNGQIVFRKYINHDGGSSSQNISLPNNLTKGVYNVEILSNFERYSKPLIIQ